MQACPKNACSPPASEGLLQQLLALLVFCLLTPVTVAQNFVATPLYGTVRLTAGLTDDPYPVDVFST